MKRRAALGLALLPLGSLAPLGSFGLRRALGSPLAQAADTASTAPRGATLAISCALGPTHPEGAGAAAWAHLIAERLPATDAKYVPGATLAGRDPGREYAALRTGTIDLAVGSALQWSSEVDALAMFALPWLAARDGDVARLTDGESGARVAAKLTEDGVVPLAIAPGSYRDLATAAPVAAPADLRGRTLRAPASLLVQETLVALDATPATMPFAQSAPRFADAGLDGEETTLAAYVAARGYALGLKHLTLWHAHADAIVFAASRAAWSRLSDAERTIVRASANQAAVRARERVAALASRDALARIAAEGASVVPLTDAGYAAFREATRDVHARWSSKIGDELVRAARADLARP